MTIQTRSKFYYTEAVTLDNQYLAFDEGGGELTAVIDVGGYNPTALLDAVARALNTSATATFTVTFDRVTNFVTIAADAPFDLLITTGANAASSIFGLLGFTGADLTGLSTYTAAAPFASVFIPTFFLQDYMPFSRNKEAVQSAVNESGSGEIEVVSFGDRRFLDFSLTYISDIDQGGDSPLETNVNAVAEAVTFMEFCTTRAPLEFMEDRDDENTYDVMRLEKTASDSKGTGYELREMISKRLAGYFDTGRLSFRKVA